MKILLAERDPRHAALIVDRLKQESFLVDHFEDGEAVIQQAQKTRYDVLVLDLFLPKRSGFEVVSALRSIGDKTPILMMSARECVEDRVLGLNLGADDYLDKNCCFAELIARIKSLLRRKYASASNIIRSGDLVVNLSNMLITRSGEPLQLTRKESGILIELLRRKGTIMSREDLLEAVWGKGEELKYSNTLDVHIRTLRKKVDHPFPEKMIQTVRGHGYMVA